MSRRTIANPIPAEIAAMSLEELQKAASSPELAEALQAIVQLATPATGAPFAEPIASIKAKAEAALTKAGMR